MRTTGILPDHNISKLVSQGHITASHTVTAAQVQPASIDLRLGVKAYRVRASFLPGVGNSVAHMLEKYTLHTLDLTDGAVLETGCVYVVPLLESLKLPETYSGTTNPKSSTGRIDVFTRVIADGADRFDDVPAGYEGPLYVEIAPRTFPIIARTGSRLVQLRLRVGDVRLSDAALWHVHTDTPIVEGEPMISSGLVVSVDLQRPKGAEFIGYRAKRHTGVVDVDKVGALSVLDFWEPLPQRADNALVLDPDEFYILASREAVAVPPNLAAEMVAIDTNVGEFRVHYAGFFDPGFGFHGANGAGSRAVLEVRSRDVPFIITHGQPVGRLVYEHMMELPKNLYGQDLNSNYQSQGLKLSKHFG